MRFNDQYPTHVRMTNVKEVEKLVPLNGKLFHRADTVVNFIPEQITN